MIVLNEENFSRDLVQEEVFQEENEIGRYKCKHCKKYSRETRWEIKKGKKTLDRRKPGAGEWKGICPECGAENWGSDLIVSKYEEDNSSTDTIRTKLYQEEGGETIYFSFRKKRAGSDEKFVQKPITDPSLTKYDWAEVTGKIKTKPAVVQVTMAGRKVTGVIGKKQINNDEWGKIVDDSDEWHTVEDSKNKSKEAWAILSAVNPHGRNDTEYSWMANDGERGPIEPVNVFKKKAARAADNFANKKFRENIGGSAKVFTDKDKFTAEYKKLTGRTPSV